MSNNIRNFCIIAHIDHGKSTLADRFLELTKTIESRKMRAQVLDQMDIERERGITIKLQPVRMDYQGYILNLIDTPGHVDFTYEVSRSLAAVEGAILLVDASQGIQAQTLANLHLALEQNLTIIPVINKIDLPNAQIAEAREELVGLLGCQPADILLVSAKTGQGVAAVLAAVIAKVPPPAGQINQPLRALIFDSVFDEYKGVIADVRLVDGQLARGEAIELMATRKKSEALELGYFKPQYLEEDKLVAGEIGYIATGLKEVSECRAGDTITFGRAGSTVIQPLPGYREVKPMVYAGFFPQEGCDYQTLREALAKLKLSDAALIFEPVKSTALGMGFRCGFLGLLHLDVVQERLKREYNVGLVVTVPSVAYRVFLKDKSDFVIVNNPEDLPDPSQITRVEEPIMKANIITPPAYQGAIMKLVKEKRGEYLDTEYLTAGSAAQGRLILHYQIPLATLIVDFYDKLKSASSGYASLSYDFWQYRPAEVVKLDVLVAEEKVEALSSIVYQDEELRVARRIVESLKDNLPRQWFEIKIQAAVGGKILASERLSALRKDVTAKLYGGDVTRKRKLLEKQKKGKKKMMARGRGSVEIPAKAFLAVLKR